MTLGALGEGDICPESIREKYSIAKSHIGRFM